MADEIGNSPPHRQRGDTSQQEIADEGLEDGSGHEQGFDPRLGDHNVPKWVRTTIWAGIPIVVGALYVFALPILVIFLESRDRLPSGQKVNAFFQVAFGPLIWLYENVGPYQDYLDWLYELL